jgi:sulfur carrier protein ThiS adenylyltransferase
MQQYDNIYVCGDQQNAVSEFLPPIAPRVGMVANMQANQVLEVLLKNIYTHENTSK